MFYLAAVLQVGFTVTDPVWTNSSSGIVLQFSTVVTNAMGGFDLSTGEFTCEYPGLYLFTMTIVRDSNFWEMFWCCFYVNGIDTGIEADAYGNDFGYPWATNVLVTHLKQGDTVYLQCYDAQYMCYATFSGVLIQADNTP